ncbi:MAG: hypothetical protein HC767_11565 [Akkermansiaceae bacterium]|nr:hypothetical protein [Akkermansiaceae bacterium]
MSQMLSGEHPQTVALVLAHLDPQHTAGILKAFDPAIGAEVVLLHPLDEEGATRDWAVSTKMGLNSHAR